MFLMNLLWIFISTIKFILLVLFIALITVRDLLV